MKNRTCRFRENALVTEMFAGPSYLVRNFTILIIVSNYIILFFIFLFCLGKDHFFSKLDAKIKRNQRLSEVKKTDEYGHWITA